MRFMHIFLNNFTDSKVLKARSPAWKSIRRIESESEVSKRIRSLYGGKRTAKKLVQFGWFVRELRIYEAGNFILGSRRE